MQDVSPPQDKTPLIKLLPRPRIDSLLADAFESSLVVLNAGPGFGKTTALMQYLEKREGTAVWFLTAGYDNDPVGFWEHLTRVFSHHKPALKEKMEVLGFPDTLQKFTQFMLDLTGELYRDENKVAFIFDDVGIINEPVILDFIKNLVEARIENSNIVLLTRRWPLFSKTLSVVPQLINGSQLSYSVEETAAYFELTGLEMPAKNVSNIYHYLSGWPIAISLVALSIRENGIDLTPDSSMPKPLIFSLFEEQIFSLYSKDEQDLLIKISALESFPSGLVQAVSRNHEKELLHLLSDSIFISYKPGTERFSFHSLYLEFLRAKLPGISQEELFQTYEDAADWCVQNGHYHDAIEYYSLCSNYEKLWLALSMTAAVRHSFSEAKFFIEQIENMPEDFKAENPMTEIVLAMLYVNNLRFSEGAALLDKVEGALPIEKSAIHGEYYLARGLLIFARDETGFETHFKEAADLLPQGSRRWDNRLQLVDLGPAITLHSTESGALEQSLQSFEKGAPFMEIAMKGAGKGIDHLAECEVRFLRADLKDAIDPAYEALYEASGVDQFDIVGNALFMLLRIYTAQGKYDMVRDTLEHVLRYENDTQAQSLGIWDIIHGWFYSDMGEIDKVAFWIRNPVQGGYAPLSLDRPMFVRMRGLIASKKYSEALALMGQIESIGRNQHSIITLINAYIGWAVTYSALDRYDDALDALTKAYALSRDNGIVMPFIEHGNRIRSLFERVRQSKDLSIPQEWIDEIYAKANTYAKHQAHIFRRYHEDTESEAQSFELSPRETELLANVSQGLTRTEIAETMGLSINTVKSLTKQVFVKLGAVNAADAVRISLVNGII